MESAFKELGFNNYDFLENYEYLGEEWMKIFKDGATSEQIYEMYKDVDSVTDLPCNYYWREILEAFPDAKVNVVVTKQRVQK